MVATSLMEEEEQEHGTLLRRVLQRAARATRAVVRISSASPSSPAPASSSPGCSSHRLSRTPSLLDCMDDGDGDSGESSFFYSAASSPAAAEVVRSPRRAVQPSPVAGAGDDIDRRAAEFIERFRRNESLLDLRYCAALSPLSPVGPPMSPDTYFKLSRLQQHGGAAAAAGGGSPAAYGRKSSLRPRPGSGMSIKWPTATAGRPTVRV
ncbi:uncharacterized protein LOC107304708 [Oryza brachyantha]|uniref:uncharacterized protein LOC107304708 n=1 Tax=Oryza brachyantha TaxID=4533 RepID=UPI001ADCF861|nr:uncharacterized protein LOC107304708 [Oryza brachyantha]